MYATARPDFTAFAKHAGPQSLRIDRLASGGRLSLNTPDTFARGVNGESFRLETTGREDKDVPRNSARHLQRIEQSK
jgi:type III restriction enzyme